MDLKGALGLGPEFTFEGQTYKLAPLQIQHYAQFSAWLERRAFEAVERAQAVLAPAAFDAALARVTRDCATGVYDYGTDTYAAAVVSPPGFKRLLLYALQVHQPQLDEEFVERLVAAKLPLAQRLAREATETGT